MPVFRKYLAGWITILLCFLPTISLAAPVDYAAMAREILDRSGVSGGVIVHVGCDEGRLTSALQVNDRYRILGLDTDWDQVTSAREFLTTQGQYGTITIDHFDGTTLPMIDGFANLVILQQSEPSSLRNEATRILCPGGVLLSGEPGQWRKEIHPRPETIDQWTHYLHGANNNPVAEDSLVGPPRHFQWVGSPRYSRHHDNMSSVSAMVSASGRVFYLFDEASPASLQVPSDWKLIARDAFNGTVLWKQPIRNWHTRFWPLKSGPAQMPRRLVAVEDRVYATLELAAPVSQLDAATGEVLQVYEGTGATDEILYDGNTLFLLVDPSQKPAGGWDQEKPTFWEIRRQAKQVPWNEHPRQIMALDPKTGKTLWRTETEILPLTLAVAGKRVFYHDGESIVCLDRTAGERLWRSEPISRRTFLRSFFAPTLVVANGVVLFSGGSVKASDTGGGTNPLFALSAETGEILWQAEHPPSGYKSPEDIFVIDETVWFGATTSGGFEGGFTGYDLKTGELKNEFTPDVQTYWFHHRCYRGKATENYLLMSRTGIEFIDFRDPSWEIHHWVRGACLYGIMPANGLLYAPQHPCACYLEAKLYGMNALAPSASRSELPDIPEQERLQRGPAYNAPETVEKVNPAVDWPTYRHDARRSAFFPQPLAPELNTQWQTGLGGRLTAPVIAGGRLYVAQKDQHRLWALDAETGERLWSFQTGGRIDSPPTIHRGRALLGCRDGYVYCLDTRTGRLAWRYLAAPATYRMGYFEQLESVWPIHGSVLVENDTLYCIAGRSVFLDGGMWLVMLDPMTGELQGKRNFDQVNPETGENLQDTVDWLNMATGMSDILSSDGETIYLRSQPIDLQGRRKEVNYEDRTSAEGGRSHLFSPTGFLDDSYWHRTYWIYGQGFFSGWSGYYLAGQRNPSGRLLAFDEDRVFGFGREPQYFRWTTPIEYRLFAAEKEPEIVPQKPPRKNQNAKYRGKPVADPAVEFTTDWSKRIGLYVRGILLTGSDGSAETFFVAGPPDMLDEDEAGKTLDTPETREKQEKLGESLRGRLGASLLAVSAETGEPLSRIPLQAPPVWDGLAAAAGKIFLVDEDGEITCFAPEAPQSGSR